MKTEEYSLHSKNELLNDIYKKYAKKMYFLAYKYLQDENLAEDIVHDAIIKIREKIYHQQIVSSEKLGNLVGLIIKGLCVDLIRRNQKFVYREIIEEEMINDDTMISRLIFNDAVTKLPEAYKEVFVMKILEDMSHKEIADRIGISEESSRKRFQRAKQILKSVWVGDEHE